MLKVLARPDRHTETMKRRAAISLTLLLACATPALAHPGGHGVSVGESAHVWRQPASGNTVTGSLLFVVGDQAHIEDITGRVHTWPLASLSTEDRSLAERFRHRVEQLNGVRRPQTLTPRPVATPALWPLLVMAAMAWWLSHTLRVQRRLVRVAAAGVAMAVPLACGGGATPTSPSTTTSSTSTTSTTSITLPQATYFASFPSLVRTRQDGTYLYVETDGMATHTMMVGIRSWQQQVPLPQAYAASNAFSIPLTARLADTPVSARTALFNGAIALAVNGIPIFNALNNRGDDAYLIGELDDFGGHSGRADDYHYHIAPLFLESTTGASRPIGVALDGFPIYGSVEPDGSAMRTLDTYNGHSDATTLYHYHGTRTYPYINGGMRGVVSVVGDHVDPQPTLKPVRPALTPLSGATITAFRATATNAWHLEYQVSGRTSSVDYRVDGAVYTYVFTDPTGATRTETYTR